MSSQNFKVISHPPPSSLLLPPSSSPSPRCLRSRSSWVAALANVNALQAGGAGGPGAILLPPFSDPSSLFGTLGAGGGNSSWIFLRKGRGGFLLLQGREGQLCTPGPGKGTQGTDTFSWCVTQGMQGTSLSLTLPLYKMNLSELLWEWSGQIPALFTSSDPCVTLGHLLSLSGHTFPFAQEIPTLSGPGSCSAGWGRCRAMARPGFALWWRLFSAGPSSLWPFPSFILTILRKARYVGLPQMKKLKPREASLVPSQCPARPVQA